MKMGGCRCSYKNCRNTTKNSEIHFFHFPVKFRERCIQWIENANKQSFYDLEEDTLKNKVICEMHFESKWFPNNHKKRLSQGAIPTLDSGCCNDINEPISPKDEPPVYLPSNQYSDVKVVPANEDGTVFVLDTENMFTISPKIESYIIKNGVLVPTNSNNPTKSTPGRLIKQSTSNRFTKPSTSSTGYVMGAETEIANINTPPGPSRTLFKDQTLQHQTHIKKEVTESQMHLQRKQKTVDNGQYLTQEDLGPPDPPLEAVERKTNPIAMKANQHSNNIHSKSGVNKSYIRQIKKHSRDIASIKRMLKKKTIAEKAKPPDTKTVLHELQKLIPSSLFTIISLILGEKNDLNEDDIEFFTTLHRGSPEVYQLLSDKYKWNLPSVDVVDTSTE